MKLLGLNSRNLRTFSDPDGNWHSGPVMPAIGSIMTDDGRDHHERFGSKVVLFLERRP